MKGVLKAGSGCLLASLLASESESQVFSSRRFQVCEERLGEEALLDRYAPRVLHWMKDDVTKHRFDHATTVDFDGDWIANNNWDNAEELDAATEPTVYGAVYAETKHQLYLNYYFFHPRDWKFFPAHENDLEGGSLIVDKSDGRIVHMYALAHNDFDDRHLGDDALELEDAAIWVESKGHGAHSFKAAELVSLDENADCFVTLAESASTGSQPPCVSPGGEWDDIPIRQYEIEPIWTLFSKMYVRTSTETRLRDDVGELFARRLRAHQVKLRGYPERAPGRLGLYKALRGGTGLFTSNSAHFPWGQDPLRFLDPVGELLKVEDGRDHGHDPIGCKYVYNPYLETILTGTLVDMDQQRDFPAALNPKRTGDNTIKHCRAAEASEPVPGPCVRP